MRIKASGTVLASVYQTVTVAAYTAPGTYTVTLPSGTGYTVAAEGGSASRVAANGSYSFAVKAKGIALTEDGGKYTINNHSKSYRHG